MKVEGYTFAAIGAFLVVTDVIYWFLSKDPTGTACLLLSGFLAGLIAYYLLFTANRLGPRPEDLGDAEISDGAGDVGFFAPFSYWPIMLAAAFATTTMGLFFGPWLFILGFFCVVVTASGLLFEFYVGAGAAARARAYEDVEVSAHH